jgi:hypothetical protein
MVVKGGAGIFKDILEESLHICRVYVLKSIHARSFPLHIATYIRTIMTRDIHDLVAHDDVVGTYPPGFSPLEPRFVGNPCRRDMPRRSQPISMGYCLPALDQPLHSATVFSFARGWANINVTLLM